MKYTITSLLFILTSSINIQAQIKNAGFENINLDSSIQFWAQSCFYAVGVGDSIISKGANISTSGDAHSGQFAIKLQNSYNATQNKYYGACMLSNNDSAGQASFINHFPINFTPETLTFYYKFDSLVVGDSAEVAVTIGALDSIMFPGTEIGSGTIKLHQKNPGYMLGTIPIVYTQNLAASFATLKVNTYTENCTPHFGTVLLLDDFNFNASLHLSKKDISNFDLYPNPASHEVNIVATKPISAIAIRNMLGQLVYNAGSQNKMTASLDVSLLPEGTYIVRLKQQDVGYTYTKLVIKH
jgi:hypothetical protein